MIGEFIKVSSQGAILNGTILTTNALLIGSAAMVFAGTLTFVFGYGTILYIDYLDMMARCKEYD